MTTKQIKLLAGAFLACQLTACASQQSIDFSVIYKGNQCGYVDPVLTLLGNDKEQAQLVNKLFAFQDDADKQSIVQSLASHNQRENVFLIAQGTKPTAGFGFEILSEKGSIQENILTLPIVFKQPDKDMMLAQVITSPCLLIGVDKGAEYRKIRVDSLQLELDKEI